MQPIVCIGCPKGPWRQPFPMDKHFCWCYPHSRLHKGIQSAFGKPQGTVTRVHIGQVTISISTKVQNKEHVIKALLRPNSSFPTTKRATFPRSGALISLIRINWGHVAEKQLIRDGCGVKYIPNHGRLDKWWALHSWEPWCFPPLIHAHQ